MSIVLDKFNTFHPIFPQNDQVLQGFSVDKGEFTCPLCRQFANSVLPCRPGRGTEAAAWHAPTNRNICVLVREVEDLQERLCLFSVSDVQFTVCKNIPCVKMCFAYLVSNDTFFFIDSLNLPFCCSFED